MNPLRIFALIAATLVIFTHVSNAAEPVEEEAYVDTINPARIYDWKTLDLLIAKKAATVEIDAKSPSEVISQLEGIVAGIEGAKKIRFSFTPGTWKNHGGMDKEFSWGRLELRLRNVPLLTLIHYVADSLKMTLSIKDGEVIFRPLVG